MDDLEELFRVAAYMVRKHYDEQAGLLLWSLVASVSERQDAEAALARLDEMFPEATCALRHRNAWQLLVATILSAQCTDKVVSGHYN